MANGGLHTGDNDYPPVIYEQVKTLYDDHKRAGQKIKELMAQIERLERDKVALMESLRMIRGEPK